MVQAGERCFSDGEGLGGVDMMLGGRRGREGAAVTMGGLERVWVSEPRLLGMDGSFVGGHFLSLFACLLSGERDGVCLRSEVMNGKNRRKKKENRFDEVVPCVQTQEEESASWMQESE